MTTSPDSPRMSSHRPYLLRALHEWISDNGMTPHILVNAAYPSVHVPASAVKDGQIVLNIAERAVHQLSLGNEYVTFNARFGGVSHEVFVPVGAVMAIYARETGQGMGLPEDLGTAATASAASSPDHAAGRVPQGKDGDGDPPDAPSPPPRRGGHLRVVK